MRNLKIFCTLIERVPTVIVSAFCLCAGIMVQNYLNIGLYFLIGSTGGSLLGIMLFYRRKRLFGSGVSITIFLIGASLMAVHMRKTACDIAELIPYGEKSVYTFNGVVNSEPVRRNKEMVFTIEAHSFEGGNQRVTCCGSVQVRVRTETALQYGDTLAITARPGKSFTQKGKTRRVVLRPASFDIIKQFDIAPRFSIRHYAGICKQKLQNVIRSSMADVPSGIISAMVLGDKAGVPARIYQSMVETGTVHILVVSGLNTGIVIAILILCLKICLVKRGYFIVFAGPFLALYSFMTGASTPVVRAALGAFICLLAFSLQRQPNIKNATFLALMVILALSPEELFGIGTQLSFASVFSIVYLYPPLARVCRIQAMKNKIILFCCQSCAVTFCAWFGTAGIIAYHFGTISLVTVPANLIIVPLGTLATVSGFITMLIGVFCKPLSHVFAGTCEVLVALMVHANAFFARLPFACLHLN